jgi:hypothetical protein
MYYARLSPLGRSRAMRAHLSFVPLRPHSVQKCGTVEEAGSLGRGQHVKSAAKQAAYLAARSTNLGSFESYFIGLVGYISRQSILLPCAVFRPYELVDTSLA